MPPFLADYAELGQVDSALWSTPACEHSLDAYEKVLVDPVVARLIGIGISARLSQNYALFTRSELAARVSAEREVVTAVGPGVARIRCALTPFRGSSLRELVPDIGPAGSSRGAVALETEIVDAQTGAVLAAYLQPSWDTGFTIGGPDSDLRCRRVISGWVERLFPAP